MFHLYQQLKNKNYATIDRQTRALFHYGAALVHLYPLKSIIDINGNEIDVKNLAVGDPVLNESRIRKYHPYTIEMYAQITMQQPKFILDFTGISINDNVSKDIYFHYNEMIERVGRKIIAGDVLELTFLRDIDTLDESNPINKFLEITDSNFYEGSWTPNYANHIWYNRAIPLVNSPKFDDILNIDQSTGQSNGNTGDNIYGGDGSSVNNSTAPLENQIIDKILEEAEKDVPFRLYDQHHVYLDEDEKPYIETQTLADGIPQEVNCEDIKYGMYFPDAKETTENMYFLRIDYDPPRLFQYSNGKWLFKEMDNRNKWTGVPSIIKKMVNSDKIFVNDEGDTIHSRKKLSELVKAKTSKEHKNPRPWSDIGLIK